MENQESPIEQLIDKVEAYGKTTFELYKCTAISESAGFISNIASKFVVIAFIMLFLSLFNIGASLWIGSMLEEPYYGFFIVALFYLVAGLVIYLLRNDLLKTPISNKIIKSFMKEELQ